MNQMTPVEIEQTIKKLGKKSEVAMSTKIQSRNVHVYYGDKEAIKGVDLDIPEKQVTARIVPSGCGKSTFAKLLCDRLEVLGGQVNRADKLRIGMFAQHQLDDLHADETPVDHVRRLMPGEAEGKVRGRVARMGLSTEKMDTK